MKAVGFQNRVDRCQEFEFVAPNTVLQWTGATDAGTAADDPQRDFRFQFRLFHAADCRAVIVAQQSAVAAQ
jgi:hypothetical protein